MKRLALLAVLVLGCTKHPVKPTVPPNCLKSHNVATGAYVCDEDYYNGYACLRYVPEIRVVCDEPVKEQIVP